MSGERASLADSFVTSQNLSMRAMEEASRWGHPEADLEHLLVALVLSEEPAGQILRRLGVDLDGVRRAVETHHADALRAVGIELGAPAAGRINAHETGGVDLSERAVTVFRAAGGLGGDATAVLRALLAEPSGVAASLLERCGTTAERVGMELLRPEARAARLRRAGVTSRSAFVSAPPSEVLGLLRDPLRRSGWDPTIERVEPDPGEPGTWIAHALETSPDGRPTRLRADVRRQRMRRDDDAGVPGASDEAGGTVTWRLSWPDRPGVGASTVEFVVEPTAGGSLVTIGRSRPTLAWWRRVLLLPLLPLGRAFAGFHVQQLAWQLSRSFR